VGYGTTLGERRLDMVLGELSLCGEAQMNLTTELVDEKERRGEEKKEASYTPDRESDSKNKDSTGSL
jgi:hypothetical protein